MSFSTGGQEIMTAAASENVRNHAAFIWSVADLLRGDYKQSEYGKVILPLTVLRRLDCVLEPTKQAGARDGTRSWRARSRTSSRSCSAASGEQFYNTSPATTSRKLLDDPTTSPTTCAATSPASPPAARDVHRQVRLRHPDRPARPGRTCSTSSCRKFAEIDLHPDAVSNLEMGYLYEELIRRFSELSNETAGEHFTPREVIRLMVNLLFIEDDDLLTKPGIVKTHARPGLRHRRDAVRRRGPPARAEPAGPAARCSARS